MNFCLHWKYEAQMPINLKSEETDRLARLNFGDCFSYAAAIERRGALLFVGEDFVQTDVLVASW